VGAISNGDQRIRGDFFFLYFSFLFFSFLFFFLQAQGIYVATILSLIADLLGIKQ
jgi:hypothetical protein